MLPSPADRLEHITHLSEPVEAVCTLEQEGSTCIEEIQDSKSPAGHSDNGDTAAGQIDTHLHGISTWSYQLV